MSIPGFLHKTQIEKFIRSELDYANKILAEIKSLNSNFSGIIASNYLSSHFIAVWLSNVFKTFHYKSRPLKELASNIDSVIFALRHIGTDESFIRLFKAFLNVDIEITTPEAGVISIKLLGSIKTNFISYITPSTAVGVKPKRIRLRQSKQGYEDKYKTLAFNFIPKGYSHSIYAFIKGMIPIGRKLKIIDNQNIEVVSFN
ncbi:DUF735 family protein (plasmid) [Borrelia puertoricensis]|uniref:DUF735 family protein n=1 Tax=Borrelia puertoricensis TaxID=2756107 RepID=UPI001FF4B9D6|nr:DUF735 family protein [Borrelia puertoricensis]UPA18499.1 DUF735 family protein [Borrelia puertoricensis]UPA18769.1 DUF735 family protein [Borrelia puertoricensis]UPA18805.1 DUF735 family protein [Borrelia puertoricensis]